MSVSEDPDWDAWLEAANTSQEELDAQIAAVRGESMVTGDGGGRWHLRPLADTRPLEEYEPSKDDPPL